VRRIHAGWLSLAVGLALGFAGCSSPSLPLRSSQAEIELDQPIADFTLTERSGRTVKRDDLLGEVWIASFIFTRCTGPCPQVSGSMARLQSEFKDEKDVRLVSFSVDPEHDRPEVLKRYADRYGADADRWLFLTGDEKVIYELSRKSFLQGVERNRGSAQAPGDAVAHSTRLSVVDRRGHFRAYYDSTRLDEELPKLRHKVADLLREKP
jgi:cytochrome oxidase Cu insertion factor (SCO1/SenC/PrrC family)